MSDRRLRDRELVERLLDEVWQLQARIDSLRRLVCELQAQLQDKQAT